jgi:RNA polymerase sigma-70 factor (ECF subfamily)
MTEQDLQKAIKDCQKGDQKAFGVIYDYYSQRLYSFIFYRVGHKEIAEDILSDTFFKAWKGIGTIEVVETFAGWLYRIAKNNIIDYYRIKESTVDLAQVEEFLRDESDPVDNLNLSFDQKQLVELIQTLPQDQQHVVRYRFFEDMSISEISQILDKSEGAIRVIQHRALNKLSEAAKKLKL